MGIKQTLNLSYSLAKANFKLRNEGSYLGIFWYLLNPLLMFSLLLLIFSDRLGNNISQYPLYLLLGIIMFNFFQKATLESTGSILRDNGLIKSINFPKSALVFSIVLKTLFSHLFEIILFGIFLIIFKVSLVGVLLYLPLLVFFYIFVLGISLILSAMTTYIVDMGNIWTFALTLIWLGTPIFYAIQGQTKLFYINLFNPIYYFITIARDLTLYSKISPFWMIATMVIYSLLSIVIGILVFNKLKNKFAELI